MIAARTVTRGLLFALLIAIAACSTGGSHAGAGIVIADPDGLLDAGTPARLVREGEAMVARVCEHWGRARPREAVLVTLVGDGGHCSAGPGGITLQVEHVPRRDLSHELVHYLCGPSWRMVSEGLATWYTERFAHLGDVDYVTLDDRTRAYFAAGVESDLAHEACREGMDSRAYEQAGSFVGFLVERFGIATVRRLYQGPPDDYVGALGATGSDLRAAWRARILAGAPTSARYDAFLATVRVWQAGEGPAPDEP